MAEAVRRQVRTTCPYCGVGCGLVAAAEGRRAEIAGDPRHPANLGKVCSKGAALASTVGLEGRLLAPMIGERAASWSEATALVAERFAGAIAEHGPDSVALYVSGQLLTEDYYAANKLMKGFVGSANIDTNSRLCMASAVVAQTLAFGADLVPGCYEDVDLADLVVLSGHNAAWTHPVLFRRIEAARGRGQRHVVIDPRRTDTAEVADLHLAIAPQTDVRLWNGLLANLISRGAVDQAYVTRCVAGFEDVVAQLQRDDQTPIAVAADCGIALADLERFFDWFAETPRTVSLFSMGANQSAHGVAKGSAIINAHLATGRIGKPGACPFSITGQPNAMGGREVGGMATTLAAHMGFDETPGGRLARFWGAPRVASRPGLKAVDMFEAVREGRIKALWIMATNPAVSLPDAGRVRAALATCPFVVVSDCMAMTDTAAFAHVRLPALAWGEKDGVVTNSERRISRQRAFLPAPGAARADWRIIADVAHAMGFGAAFAWRSPAEVFAEWARLTTFENDGVRTLDLGPLASLSPEDYAELETVQWPVSLHGGTARLFTDGRFQTPDSRARMVPAAPEGPAEPVDLAYPLALNTGRVRDHWHTMTRTGLAPQLCRHTPEPYVDVHPADAERFGLVEGRLARIETRTGEAVAIVRVTHRQRAGQVFMPMHWTDAFAPTGRANALVAPNVDARSGQPEFKHTPARVSPYGEMWRGFLIARTPAPAPKGVAIVWRRTPQANCHVHEFAGLGDASERAALVAALRAADNGDTLSFEDPATGTVRMAGIVGGRLDRALFVTAAESLPPSAWLAELFGAAELTPADRTALLLGRPPGRTLETGPIVCACRGVRVGRILAAISDGADDVDRVSAATGAGTSCGSCIPELARMLTEASRDLAEAR